MARYYGRVIRGGGSQRATYQTWNTGTRTWGQEPEDYDEWADRVHEMRKNGDLDDEARMDDERAAEEAAAALAAEERYERRVLRYGSHAEDRRGGPR